MVPAVETIEPVWIGFIEKDFTGISLLIFLNQKGIQRFAEEEASQLPATLPRIDFLLAASLSVDQHNAASIVPPAQRT